MEEATAKFLNPDQQEAQITSINILISDSESFTICGHFLFTFSICILFIVFNM